MPLWAPGLLMVHRYKFRQDNSYTYFYFLIKKEKQEASMAASACYLSAEDVETDSSHTHTNTRKHAHMVRWSDGQTRSRVEAEKKLARGTHRCIFSNIKVKPHLKGKGNQ